MRGRNLIILDENLDPDLKGQLQNRGYEADSVRDLQLLNLKDGALLAWLGDPAFLFHGVPPFKRASAPSTMLAVLLSTAICKVS